MATKPTTCTIEIHELPATPDLPDTSWAVEVLKPNGRTIGGPCRFKSVKTAEAWGRETAKASGYIKPTVVVQPLAK